MSEPMTKFEIEDVLSSIRRLVSEDVSQKPARPDLLVLTQALRVPGAEAGVKFRRSVQTEVPDPVDAEALAESDSPEAEAAELVDWEAAEAEFEGADAFFGAAPPDDDVLSEAGPERSLEDRIVELESVIARSDEEFEPDGSEDPDTHTPRFFPRSSTSRPLAAEPVPAEAEAEAAADQDLSAFSAPDPEPVGDDFMAGFGDTAYDAEAEEEPGVAAATEPDPFEIDPFAAPQAEAPPADVADGDTTEADIAEPEAAQAEAPAAAELEPADDRQIDADNLYAPADSAEPSDLARPRAGGTAIEEALIDEDALREIVGALVREELRGELGERITRNVRRLIRREIHRAMSLQELADDDE